MFNLGVKEMCKNGQKSKIKKKCVTPTTDALYQDRRAHSTLIFDQSFRSSSM